MNLGFVETFISKYLVFEKMLEISPYLNYLKQCYFPRFPSKFFSL